MTEVSVVVRRESVCAFLFGSLNIKVYMHHTLASRLGVKLSFFMMVIWHSEETIRQMDQIL